MPVDPDPDQMIQMMVNPKGNGIVKLNVLSQNFTGCNNAKSSMKCPLKKRAN